MHTSCMFKYISLQTCVNLFRRFLTALADAPDSSLFFLRSDLTIIPHEHGIYSINFTRLFFRKNTSVTVLVTHSWPYTLWIHPSAQLQASCPQKTSHLNLSPERGWIQIQQRLRNGLSQAVAEQPHPRA